MNGSEIINEVLNVLGINAKTLSERLGYERPQGIYDLKKGKTKAMSSQMANKISSVFPEFNKTWLLTGEGSILKKENELIIDPPHFENETVAYLIEANRGLQRTIDSQTEMIESLQKNIDLLLHNHLK